MKKIIFAAALFFSRTNILFAQGAKDPVQKPKKEILDAPPKIAISGTWKGTYGYGQANGPLFYSLKLNGDHSLQVIDSINSIIGIGHYDFLGNRLTATYNLYKPGGPIRVVDPFTIVATQTGRQLIGFWSKYNNRNDEGRLIMTKN